MTFESVLSKMGTGMKQFTDRYAEYGPPVQDQHLYYTYEPQVQHTVHEASSKHNYGGGHKNNAAMSALTLLAFLFFLHILQQCIKDHMTAMSTPQITIMTAGREGEEALKKDDAKIDKTGLTIDATIANNMKTEGNKHLMKINMAEPPKSNGQNYRYAIKNRERTHPDFVSAMNDEDFVSRDVLSHK